MADGGRGEHRAALTNAALAGAGLIDGEQAAALGQVAARYAVAVTPHLARAIAAERAGGRADGQADGPLARQFLPDKRELDSAPDDQSDPIGDGRFTPVPGITHRYPDRVLLKPTLACAAYCRFCFRREVVGQGDGMLGPAALARAIDYIGAHPEIWEVILSGGDPLILSDRRLADIVRRLDMIDHVATIRIHTRAPIAAPDRVNDRLIDALRAHKPVYIVVHCNHADELTEEVTASLAALADGGFPLLAQTVLLRGVNDDADTLARLFRALLQRRVKPYYLHHPDLAPGTGHFRLSIAEGQALMRALRGRISGLCLPEYVLDIPGGHGKVPVGPTYLDSGDVTDPMGGRHPYPPG